MNKPGAVLLMLALFPHGGFALAATKKDPIPGWVRCSTLKPKPGPVILRIGPDGWYYCKKPRKTPRK